MEIVHSPVKALSLSTSKEELMPNLFYLTLSSQQDHLESIFAVCLFVVTSCCVFPYLFCVT